MSPPKRQRCRSKRRFLGSVRQLQRRMRLQKFNCYAGVPEVYRHAVTQFDTWARVLREIAPVFHEPRQHVVQELVKAVLWNAN